MISIIIPTYRPQDYLWQCLDSFAAQTLDKRLWELVVVLNGESEPWLNQLKDYRDSHPDMHIQIFHTETTGVSNARNIGLDKAKGEYIGFVDDDDYVSPTYLEELASIATPDTVSAAFSIAFDETYDHIQDIDPAVYRSGRNNMLCEILVIAYSSPQVPWLRRRQGRPFPVVYAIPCTGIFLFPA